MPSEFPARPSLDSLRKQARRLTNDIAAGDPNAIDRARKQLPHAELPLSRRDAQLVVAREYGFPGWKDLVKEVEQRLGRGLEWAVSEARHVIHDNDVESLRALLSEYPALLSWTTDEDDSGLLGMATRSYGDSGDAFCEQHYTRLACAEALVDAGAVVAPSICENLIKSRANRLIDLFHRKDLFPRSLKFLAALGDIESVRARLDADTDDLATLNEAFQYACHLRHEETAAALLDRAITLDPEMGRHIDSGPGRSAFVQYFVANKPDVHSTEPFEPWKAFIKQGVDHAMRDGDRTTFIDTLRSEAWILSEASVRFQARLIEVAVLNDRADLLKALLDLNPAILHSRVPPSSQAIEFAFTYVKTHLLPMLLRIWPMPDDLPHAAGRGDLARVTRWFDAKGRPALGDLKDHFPESSGRYRDELQAWFGDSQPNAQRILDTALAWSVLNNHFEVADFLLAHGADINTNWGSHEPASILHELVWHKNYEAMQFLIDRGIDMTIRDYRWSGTAAGWAEVAANDEEMARWLRDAESWRQRQSR